MQIVAFGLQRAVPHLSGLVVDTALGDVRMHAMLHGAQDSACLRFRVLARSALWPSGCLSPRRCHECEEDVVCVVLPCM